MSTQTLSHPASAKVTNRNRAVLDAALSLAETHGYKTMTRQQVADAAGVAVGSVNNAFGTMEGLRDAVMAAAVKANLHRIIAQGLTDRHPATQNLPPSARQAAFASLAN